MRNVYGTTYAMDLRSCVNVCDIDCRSLKASTVLIKLCCEKQCFLLLIDTTSILSLCTNLWNFRLNWSSKLQENSERKKSLSQIQILGWKLPLSLKLHYFKVFRFETKFDSVSRSSVPFTENIIMVLKICIHFIYFIKKKLLYDRNLR